MYHPVIEERLTIYIVFIDIFNKGVKGCCRILKHIGLACQKFLVCSMWFRLTYRLILRMRQRLSFSEHISDIYRFSIILYHS